MKKLLTSLGVSLAVAAGLPLASAVTAQAQDITPGSKPPVGANYGLFQSADSEAVRVRLADGSSQTYPLSKGVVVPSTLNQGDLVVFDANRKGVIKNINAPETETVVEGTVDRIEGENVTLVPDQGAPMGTTIPEGTISRLGLQEGQRLRVTKYQGLGTTRVCALPAPPVVVAPPPIEVAPPPVPVGAPEPLPEPEPIPALW